MVIDVTESTFAQDVLERSRSVPVVVDFWAAWCGPCRSLGPLLERAAERREGEVVLAKVDVDANPRLQMQFDIRGIPAVKAFRDGRVAAEFVGAQPSSVVERFFDGLVPSQADRLAAAGDEESLRRAIELDPGHATARVGLARGQLAHGNLDEALDTLGLVEHDPRGAALIAEIELLRDGGLTEPVRAALLRLVDGDPAGALPPLITALRQTAGETRDRLRRVVVGVFAELGEDHPLTRQHRPELAAALY
ncbi:MAG TPA: tetratricopeptide repeat protein [Candidatus Dormibacteraeota bacterium]|nr:tetratricopeptide repeat protein [Candidatus Dormibacteraeota bacterium]